MCKPNDLLQRHKPPMFTNVHVFLIITKQCTAGVTFIGTILVSMEIII